VTKPKKSKGKPGGYHEPTVEEVKALVADAAKSPPPEEKKLGIFVEPTKDGFAVVEVVLNRIMSSRKTLRTFPTEQEADRYATVEAERIRLLNPTAKTKKRGRDDYRNCWTGGPKLMEVDEDE
jgi:hypothetical protein